MKNFLIALTITITCFFSSCSNNNNVISPQPVIIQKLKLAEGYSSGTKIELYSDDTLRSGYNRFYIRMLDSATNSVVRDANIDVTPEMNMGTMKHSCPTEQTPSFQITGEYFPISAVFTMAESSMNKWMLHVYFKNNISNKESMISFPITVKSGIFSAKTFVATDGTQMVLAMIPITKPIVGMNDIEFAVFSKSNDLFKTIDDVTMEIIPEMPSMGHGSPNNINPISIGNGHYIGKVNFIMTGEWKINLKVRRSETEISQQYFMITL